MKVTKIGLTYKGEEYLFTVNYDDEDKEDCWVSEEVKPNYHCNTQGDNVPDLINNIKEALALLLDE